jgi:hypothetical protein
MEVLLVMVKGKGTESLVVMDPVVMVNLQVDMAGTVEDHDKSTLDQSHTLRDTDQLTDINRIAMAY